MPAITVEGDQILRGGEPWWFLGYNSFVWSGHCGNPDEKMTTDDVEQWSPACATTATARPTLLLRRLDLDRLDAAVRSARRHNIYLTITLDDAIGGCGENDKDATWFADQSERDTYRTPSMQTLLQRYRGDTTFAWFEFFNEPDDENGALRAFYDEMGTTADTIDPDRLFSSGTVAPYWVDGEANFLDIHQSPAVDIASLHAVRRERDRVQPRHRVGANSAGKPVIVGEFGITACEGGFSGRGPSGWPTRRRADVGRRLRRRVRLGLAAQAGAGADSGTSTATPPRRRCCARAAESAAVTGTGRTPPVRTRPHRRVNPVGAISTLTG